MLALISRLYLPAAATCRHVMALLMCAYKAADCLIWPRSFLIALHFTVSAQRGSITGCQTSRYYIIERASQLLQRSVLSFHRLHCVWSFFECRVECFLTVGVSGDKGCQAVRLSRPVTRLRCSSSQAVRLIKLSAGISFSVCVGSVQSFRCLSLRLRRMMTTVIRAAIHTWLSCVLALVAINKTSRVSIESPCRPLQYWFPIFLADQREVPPHNKLKNMHERPSY